MHTISHLNPDAPRDRLADLLGEVQSGTIVDIHIGEHSLRPVAVLMSHTDYQTLMAAATDTQAPSTR